MADAKICDRCGELMEKTYYEIDITAHDVNATVLSNSETLSHNICTSMAMALNGKKSYCNKCVNEIKKVINSKGE